MEPKANASHRPVILATAALTVAVGLTVASLGGYLRPRSADPKSISPEPAPTVLVPVTAPAPLAPPPSEPMFASYTGHEQREHAEHEGRRHEREHDHEED